MTIEELKKRYSSLQDRRNDLNTKREKILTEIRIQTDRKNEILQKIKEISGKDTVEEAQEFLNAKMEELSKSLDFFETNLDEAEKSLRGE